MKRKKHTFRKLLLVFLLVLAATAAGIYLGLQLPTAGQQIVNRLIAASRQVLQPDTGTDQTDQAGIQEEQESADTNGKDGKADAEQDFSYYYYDQLTEEEQEYYNAVLAGLNDMDASIRVDTTDQDVLWKVYTAVLDDHPELYWVEYKYTGTSLITYANLTPEYNCTAEEKKQKDTKLEKAEEEALAAVSGKESEYETVKSVFEYAVDTLSYDDNAEDNQNIYSSLVNHKTVCAGYSREVQYLLQKLGIETIFVAGTITDRGSHAWNMVKVNGSWYQLDATFGDRAFTTGYTEDMPEELHYDYSYLCSDDRIMQNRTLDEELEVPECTSEDLNYYKLQGIYFDSYDSTVRDSVTDSLEDGKRYWRCQFSNTEAYEAMMDDINDNWYARQIREYGEVTDSQITTWNVHDDDNLVICLWY